MPKKVWITDSSSRIDAYFCKIVIKDEKIAPVMIFANFQPTR